MLVLSIAFVVLVSLLVILAKVCLGRELTLAPFQGRRRGGHGQLLAGLTFEQAFDRNYWLIWQTQAPALHLVHCAGDSGLPVEGLKPWFRRAARHHPALYDGFCFDDWLFFLHQSGLIDLSGGRVRLTPEGRGFLHHCRVAR